MAGVGRTSEASVVLAEGSIGGVGGVPAAVALLLGSVELIGRAVALYRAFNHLPTRDCLICGLCRGRHGFVSG